MTVPYDFLFKCVLTGPSCSGKSSLLDKFSVGYFSETYTENIGADYRMKYIPIRDYTCQLQLWDTSGADHFWSIAPGIYKLAHVILILYDTTDMDSFLEATTTFVEGCTEYAPGGLIFLVGTKIDLESQRQVDTSEGKKIADEMGIEFLETSAMDGINVESVFKIAATKLVNIQLKKI
jgi:Ras-related protein Rab-1A